MSLNPQLAAELCRQRLGLPDASRAAQFINLIPDALKATARKIAQNPHLRDLLITNPATTTGAIGAGGKVNLALLYTTYNILLEFLDVGQIYHSGSNYPLQKRSPQEAALAGAYDSIFYHYWIEGDYLTAQGNGVKLTGNLAFAVPYFPETLAALPESEEVETMFISKLCELATVPANDYAEDGVK